MTTPSAGSPSINPDISRQLSNWNWANSQMHLVDAEYSEMIQELVIMTKDHKAAQALWLFQTQCMPLATQSCEYSMQTQTDALNIANDLRNDITGAQNAYNQLIAELEKEKVSPKAPINTAAHQCASNAAKQLSGFLAKLSAEFNLTKLKGVFPSGTISSLHNYIKTIRDNGQTPPASKNFSAVVCKFLRQSVQICYTNIYVNGKDYHRTKAVHTHNFYTHYPTHGVTHIPGKGFVSTMSGMYWNVFNSHGVVPPQFTQITNAFNDLNQSVSGISSSIQAQMQYLNQNLQQFFGIYKSFFDDYSQLSSYIVNRTAQS